MKAQNKKEHDPQVELNVSKIQRSQEPSADDDSEGRKSDDGDQEDIYTERVIWTRLEETFLDPFLKKL